MMLVTRCSPAGAAHFVLHRGGRRIHLVQFCPGLR